MDLTLGIIIFLVGYLFGSLSFARIITRILNPKAKLEEVEWPDVVSGGTYTLNTVGATTASMVLGPRIGATIGIIDILKGALLVLFLRLLFPDQPYYLFVGLAIVVGHIWPIFYKFRGGGGLSPTLGVLLVIDPLGTILCTILALLLGMFVFKEIAFIVMGGPILFVFWTALIHNNRLTTFFVIVLNILLIVAVIPDMAKHFKAVRSGKIDLSSSMDYIPMGQMMKKMMIRLGIEKK